MCDHGLGEEATVSLDRNNLGAARYLGLKQFLSGILLESGAVISVASTMAP
jgi:hypothetical protein